MTPDSDEWAYTLTGLWLGKMKEIGSLTKGIYTVGDTKTLLRKQAYIYIIKKKRCCSVRSNIAN